ncbi:P-loop containing nucleoside triphosphate hydrolase protein [Annulohypoxylon stygium]|nr:P-loop containing nucleoside triphosphate hydrolase protein [Annulohypoxylon stygium]
MKVKSRWLLASDLHFKLHDLDRVIRTADWIASIPRQYNISRAIICGDVFTTRTSQPTNVLAACYRFLGQLASAVPHMNIILGNHDLAYRRDYTTSALEALATARLAPFVTLHTEIGCHSWDGRRVIVMPFREDQGEIIKYIRELDPKIAANTVGFGHLAINRAITQKHIINPETGMPGLPSRYPGLTSASEFSSLARTFTGHFHSHQTIFQAANKESQDPQGSITYIGAPLQLTWADLFDTKKGVILLDPKTLEFEYVENPYAVDYTCVEAQEVLADKIDAERVWDKHVMITGKMSMGKYISTRDRLIKLGVRSVRDGKHVTSEWQFGQMGLGKTALPADVENKQTHEKEVSKEAEITRPDLADPLTTISQELTTGKVELKPIDLVGLVEEYVSSLGLESTLENRRVTLSLVGKRLFHIHGSLSDKTGGKIKYRDFLDPSAPSTLFIPENDALQASTAETIFAANPVAIEITNFLGVQGTLSLDFKHHFQPGINMIVGHNGAGKSTIIEAIVWCQFGQCIRGGLGVNDVVNDVVGKNCGVRLTFANGYTISRFRKHSEFRNRVIVEKDGIIQPQFEGPDSRNTQASIDNLLGIDFDTFIRIVLLGNESAPSFLNSTTLQKRQLIELVLGLEVLDGCAETCNSMLSQVEEELGDMRSQLDGDTHKLEDLKTRINQLDQTLRRLQQEVASLSHEIEDKKKKHQRILSQKDLNLDKLKGLLKAEQLLPDLKPELLRLSNDISPAQSEVNRLGVLARLAQARSFIDRERVIIEQEVTAAKTQLRSLDDYVERLIEDNERLEIPSSNVEDETPKRDNIGNVQGFLLNITQTFQKLWTLVLNIISPAARERTRIKGEIARKAMEARQRWDEHTKTIITFANKITLTQGRVASIADTITGLPRNVAIQTHLSESDVHLALQKLTTQEALKVPNQLNTAIDGLKTLTNRHAELQLKCERQERERFRKQRAVEEQEKEIERIKKDWADSTNRGHLLLAKKEQEITTYKGILVTEAESLSILSRQVVDLSKKVTGLHSDREIFAFWQTALTRRQVAASKTTFRRHVIGRHLGELNKLLAQILMVMYQDAHLAHSMMTGTLKTLFEGDDGEADDERIDDGDSEKTSVLEPSLSMTSTLGYSKKSGGERKRVDLALFFALFVMSEARSAHRAGYMLVDEAFDGLDTAGQAAVLKMCRWMTGRLAYVFVITHSQTFIALAEDGNGAEGATGAGVITAKAGDKGTELEVNGVKISSSPEDAKA